MLVIVANRNKTKIFFMIPDYLHSTVLLLLLQK